MAKLVKSVRSVRSIKRVRTGCVVEVVKGGETARYTRVNGGWTARVAHGKYSPWEDVVTVFTSWEVAQQVNDVAPYHTREHHAYIF